MDFKFVFLITGTKTFHLKVSNASETIMAKVLNEQIVGLFLLNKTEKVQSKTAR